MSPITIELFRWAGKWGPFKVKIPCGECSITEGIIHDTLKHELKGIPIRLEIKDWLSFWWQPLIKGGWHAPIVIVGGKVISQGQALNRGLLTQAIMENYSLHNPIQGNHFFGKEDCPYCIHAKAYLKRMGLQYCYYDVIKSTGALYNMLGRVKSEIGPKTPVTLPQIWIDGKYIGGAAELDIMSQLKECPEGHLLAKKP